jgi:CPA2 family monovalent cation:H+ antiporter-2
MLLDPVFLWQHIGVVALVVGVVGLGKGLILAGVSRVFGYRNIVPLAVGLGLFQIGEFSFVLGRVGVSTGSISTELYSIVLTAAVVTMMLTPLISGQARRLYAWRRQWFRHERIETANLPEERYEGHTIIAGCGRVGFQLAQMLERLERAYIVVEADHHRYEQAKEAGMAAIFGDAGQETVLQAANIEKASVVALTMPELVTTRRIILEARRLNEDVEMVARASAPDYCEVLTELGVCAVALPEFEAGLEMTRQALLGLGMAVSEAHQHTDGIRHDLYASVLRDDHDYRLLCQLRQAEEQFDLEWVHLVEGSPLVHRSLAESDIRKRTGAAVVGVVREGKLTPNPEAEFVLLPEDHVAVMGSTPSREALRVLAVVSAEGESRE